MSWSNPGKAAAAGGVAALVAFAAAGGPPAALRFTNAPVQVQAGFCSPPLTVELADDAGTTAIAPADTPVGLAETDLSGAVLFCGSNLGSATIDAGTSAVSFDVWSTRAGRYPMAATSPGLAAAAQDVEILPGPPAQAAFVTSAFGVDVGACSPERVVQLEDSYGNPSPATAPISLNISATPSTTVKAYSDPACQTEIQALAFPASASRASFYFKDPLAELFNLRVSDGSISGAQSGYIRPGNLLLQLELAGAEVSKGAELELRAVVSYPDPGVAQFVTLKLAVEGAARAQPIDPLTPITIGSGLSAQLAEPLIVTAMPGEDVVVRGRTVLFDGTQVGPEVTVTRPVVPMTQDLGGGCGCASAGGADLALAAVALALLRGSRRRSLCSR